MVYSNAMILLWERWRQTRWAVITACLLPFMGCLLYISSRNSPIYIGEDAVLFLWYLGFLLLTFILLVSHCETRDLDLSFSKRLFQFPVSTTTLFAVYMGYGVATIALQFLVLFGLEKLFIETISYKWSHILWFETVYIGLQSLSWLSWLVGPGARFLFLSSSFTCVYGCSVLVFLNRDNFFTDNIILSPIIILICGVIAFWSISIHRHGVLISNWRWIDSLLGIFRKKPSKRFASALQAQIWFEMRQTGRLFPLTSLCVIFILLFWWVLAFRPTPLFSNFVPIVFLVTIPTAFIAGFLVFGVYHRDHVSRASSFWRRRPIATRTLAVARLHAMVRSLAGVLVTLTVVTLAVAAHNWATETLSVWRFTPVTWALKYSSPIEIVTITILGLYGFALFYWTMLRLAPAILISGIVIAFLTCNAMRLLIGHIAVSWMWNAMIVGLPVVVMAAFCAARFRNLITTTTLVIATCLFPMVVVSLWAFPWWSLTGNMYLKGLHSLSLNQIIILISAATLPFIPVVATPLLMDKLRHR